MVGSLKSKVWGRKASLRTPVLAAFSALALAGCDHFFGHDRQVRDPLVVQDQGLSCLRKIGDDFNEYLEGKDQDLVRMADCVSGSLTKFADNTRGGSLDGWTHGELASFFETYFKQEFDSKEPTSQSVGPLDTNWAAQARRRSIVTEVFRWKAALIGGGSSTLSRDELKRIRTLLSGLRPVLADLRGQGRLLTFKQQFMGNSVDVASLEKTALAIQALGQILNGELSSTIASKSNAQAREPMTLQVLSSSLENAGLSLLQADERRQLLKAVKTFVLAGNPSEIAGTEWGELALQTTALWAGALRFQYGIIQNAGAFDRDLGFVENTVRDLTTAVRRMVKRHDGRIELDVVRGLVSEIGSNRLLPLNLKVKSINSALEVIFGKILGGNSLANQAELKQGLALFHLDRIDELVKDWAEGQRVASEILGPAGFATVDQAKLTMSQIATTSKEPTSEIVRLQMSEIVLRGRPLIRDISQRLLLLPKDVYTGYGRSDFRGINLARTLMSSVMRSYSHESARAGSMPQITEAEVQELFTDIKTIGRDLGIVDIRSLQSGIRTFMETNVFLSVSDGNQYISLHEMVEWYETVRSAGVISDQMHGDLIVDRGTSTRCDTSPLDVFGKSRLNAQCFRESFPAVLRSRLSHLPNFILALNYAERSRQLPKFIAALEAATRPLGVSDLPLESTDIRVMSVVIHYVEALFARYDVDRSGVLEHAEVWSVFPLIRPFIKKLAVGSDGEPLKLSAGEEKAVFSWMIEKGEPPQTTVKGKIAFKLHQWTVMPLSDNKAEFSDILKILGGFNQVGRDKKNKEVLEMYLSSAEQWSDGIARGDKQMFEKTRDLLQCAAEADTDLTRLMQSRRADIFAVNPKLNDEEQSLEFLSRFKALIQSDPQLQLLCLAF